MGLPASSIPTGEVTLRGGATVSVRGLRRGEVLAVNDIQADDGLTRLEVIEVHTLSCGTETSREATADWYRTADARDVDAVLEAIGRLSGLREDEGKGDGAA